MEIANLLILLTVPRLSMDGFASVFEVVEIDKKNHLLKLKDYLNETDTGTNPERVTY